MLRQIIHDRIRDAEAAAAIARDRAGLCDSGQAALRETFLTLATALDDMVDLNRQLDMAATMNHDTIKNRRQHERPNVIPAVRVVEGANYPRGPVDRRPDDAGTGLESVRLTGQGPPHVTVDPQ